MTEAELKTELERAYRALQAFARIIPRGQEINQAMLAYHAPTVAASARFVYEDALDGSQYFIGKPVRVMQESLEKVWPRDAG